MPTPRTSSTGSSSRSASAARNEILALLKEDHKRLKKASKQFEKLDPSEDAEECEALVRQTCGELQVHAALEEELFYPSVRDVIKEPDLVDEAEVEHMSAKSLIEQLQGMSPDDEKFAATFKVLCEYTLHHIKEEEGEMFKQLGRAKADWESIWAQMQTRREELMQEYVPEMAEMEDDTSARKSASQRGASRSGASSSSRAGGRSAESRAQASDDESDE